MYLESKIRQSSPISIPTLAAVAIIISLVLFVLPYAHASSQNTPPGTSQLNIISGNTSGQIITGYFTALSQNGSEVAMGYSPTTFTLTNGQTYTIVADSYGSCTFDHWSDDGMTGARQVVIASTTSIVAIYNCMTTTVTVQSMDQNGNAIPGYFSTISHNGIVYSSEYTTAIVLVFTGQTYSVVAASYGACTFNHWSDGSTSNPRTFVASAPGTTLIAVYGCST